MAFLAPFINEQQEDVNGKPLAGGRIWVYLAGTSTPATTYSDKAGLNANTNPIILNSLGVNVQGSVWLTGGSAYKFVITDSSGTLQRTIDDVSGINDTTVAADQWVVHQGTPTYVSATSFTVPGDQTLIFQVGRRVKTTNTGGTAYGTILSSAYVAPNTTVTLTNTSGVLDAGLSAVSYGLISPNDTSLPPGRLVAVTAFTVTGTWTRNENTAFAIAEVQGAGGAGGGAAIPTASNNSIGAPGASGSWVQVRMTAAQIGATQPVTIGAGGVGVVSGAGGTGGTTSIGTLAVAPGGPGGPTSNDVAPPVQIANGSAAGTPTSTATILASSQGAAGNPSIAISSVSGFGGGGGVSRYGAGGLVGFNSVGSTSANKGGGGGGTCSTSGVGVAVAGGGGGAGFVLIYEYA